MKLSGNYSLEDLVRTLQGNFSCREFTKTANGKLLDSDKQYIRIELFFVAVEIYHKASTPCIKIFKIKDDEKGTTELYPLMVLEGKSLDKNN